MVVPNFTEFLCGLSHVAVERVAPPSIPFSLFWSHPSSQIVV